MAKKVQVMPEDMAKEEFERFADAMDIDTDVDSMDDDDAQAFRGLVRKIIVPIMAGRLTVNDDGEPSLSVQTDDGAKLLKFAEPTGAVLMATDGGKKNAHVAALNRMMGQITGQSPAFFAKMKARDYKVCSAITTLFLA